MVGHYLGETIANWAADFTASDAGKLFPEEAQEYAQAVLAGLLTAACDARGVEPAAITEADLKSALLGHLAKLGLPDGVRPFVPSLCRAFLGDLQTRGRLGHGADFGRYVGALKEAFLEASRGRPATFVRPGAKIGRNDPCLCGSGKKYKHCCGAKAG
jgi:hypothetical protein